MARARFDEGHDLLRDMARGTVGRVALETLERHAVGALHALCNQRTGLRLVGINAQPKLHPHLHIHIAARLRGGVLDDLLALYETCGRLPDARVAVAIPPRAHQRRVAPPPDEQGHRCQRLRIQGHVVELEVLSLEGHVVFAPQQAQDLEGFVRAGPARLRIDAATRELVWIFAPDAHAEDEPPHAQLIQRRYLERDGHGVTKRQQVDARPQLDSLGHRCDGGQRL